MNETILIRHAEIGTQNRRKRAVLYLRVSTPGQVQTDYNPEGISIPAQREAGKFKADSLEAEIVEEFVEPGRTATSIEKRPKFQEMLAWVKAQGDIDYVIVYHFNRVFRNSVDAAITKRDLKKVGTRIVSTVLDMGDSPESAMVESIIHAVDQYQSQASGADIKYKMAQKVKNGGWVGSTRVGYLNVREPKPDGGEIRTVAIDPERAPLVTEGFEQFGTGRYSAREVLDQLTAAGLRTKGTPKRPPRPIALSVFYAMLSDSFYVGKVTYEEQEYPGRHAPLVSQELFDRVQRVLAIRGGSGTRQRRHHHWLKGLLWCHRCGYRLIINRGKGNGGEYFYFICRGRQERVCDLPYLHIDSIEAAVERHYATVRLSQEFRTNLSTQLDEALLDEQSTLNSLKRRLSNRLSELDAREDSYLDLLGGPDWPSGKIKKKLAAIKQERTTIEAQLADTTSKLETGRRFYLAALELLSDPQEAYRRGNAAAKKAMTKVIFDKLGVDAVEPNDAEVASHELADGIRAWWKPTRLASHSVRSGSLPSSRQKSRNSKAAPSRRMEPL